MSPAAPAAYFATAMLEAQTAAIAAGEAATAALAVEDAATAVMSAKLAGSSPASMATALPITALLAPVNFVQAAELFFTACTAEALCQIAATATGDAATAVIAV